MCWVDRDVTEALTETGTKRREGEGGAFLRFGEGVLTFEGRRSYVSGEAFLHSGEGVFTFGGGVLTFFRRRSHVLHAVYSKKINKIYKVYKIYKNI